MTACTTFPRFSYLPIEIRLAIWTINLPRSRLVDLHYTSATTNPSECSTEKELRGCTSPSPIPANLHVNKEARSHAMKHYQLSFSLPHCAPKIWFDMQSDVLYFPAKRGWLGSWNHFVTALTMINPEELGKVKKLAVHEALFKRVRDASSSLNIEATCVKGFWDYVKRKFGGLEEAIILFQGGWERKTNDDDARVWMAGVQRCVLGKDGIWIGSPEEKLVEGLERGLRFMEEGTGWTAPRWEVLGLPVDVTGAREGASPTKRPAESYLESSYLKKPSEVIDDVVISRAKAVVKKGQGFWMGGQLPRWHYLARAS